MVQYKLFLLQSFPNESKQSQLMSGGGGKHQFLYAKRRLERSLNILKTQNRINL